MAVILIAVLHFVPDDPRIAQTRALYNGGLFFRSRKEIEGLFDGFELVEPGVVGVGQWRRHLTADDDTSWWLGGVARKP